jgi:two-component system nitrate/nitrite sensor histidine kinase NarX
MLFLPILTVEAGNNIVMSHHKALNAGALHQEIDLLRAERDRLRAAYDSAAVGLLDLDESGIIMAINQTAADWLGSGLLGRRFAYCVATEDRDTVYVLQEALYRDGLPLAIDARLLDAHGTRFNARLSARLNADGDRCLLSITSLSPTHGELLVEAAADAIISHSLDGTILSWNPGAEQLYGYTAAEMLREPIARLMPPERFDSEISFIVDRVRGDQQMEHYETVRIRKDGRPIQVSLAVFPLYDAEEQLTGVGSIARDITPRKQIEEKVRYQADLLENVSDAIISTNLDQRVQSWNRAAETIYGWHTSEVLGRSIDDLIRPVYADSTADAVARTVFEQGGWRGECIHHQRDGTPLNVYTSISVVYDSSGKVSGTVLATRDITQLKQVMAAEREQRVLAQALRDTALALSSTLNLPEVLDKILSSIGEVIPHDVASIMLIEDEMIRIVGTSGYGDEDFDTVFPAPRFPIAEMPVLERAFAARRAVIVSDIHAAEPDWLHLTATDGVSAYLGIPISLQDRIIGFLNLGSAQPGFYTAAHAERAEAFANQAAIAIHNAQLHAQTGELAALEERQRLARDLHDSVSQMLFSSSIITQALPWLWQDTPEGVNAQLEQLHRLNRGALAEMRNLLMELRPARMLRAELSDLLRQLVDGLMGRTRINIQLKVEGKHELPPDVKLALYRITQEALNNIIKHAHATDILIHLDSQAEQVILGVRDNGRGFDVDAATTQGMGMPNMRERAAAIGASCQIISEHGVGTEVLVIWMRKPERRNANGD